MRRAALQRAAHQHAPARRDGGASTWAFSLLLSFDQHSGASSPSEHAGEASRDSLALRLRTRRVWLRSGSRRGARQLVFVPLVHSRRAKGRVQGDFTAAAPSAAAAAASHGGSDGAARHAAAFPG